MVSCWCFLGTRHPKTPPWCRGGPRCHNAPTKKTAARAQRAQRDFTSTPPPRLSTPHGCDEHGASGIVTTEPSSSFPSTPLLLLPNRDRVGARRRARHAPQPRTWRLSAVVRRVNQLQRAAVGGTAGHAATTVHRSLRGQRTREHEAAGEERRVLLGFLWTAPRPPPHRPPPTPPSHPSPRARPSTRCSSFTPSAMRRRHRAAPPAARRATAHRRPRPRRAPPRAAGRRGPLEQPTRAAADCERRRGRHAARGRHGA